jgi:ligand-binding sensor domain-containing protein/tRNA A-37 threonylcarbamoyl transferase component Bud32
MNSLQPGQQLGPYQIVQQIGKGGMATVYKAYHPSMDRYVALKVVSDQLIDNTEMLQRFQQEARLIAKLEHPHILPVHDYGEADGMPYMVMRFLEAGTLKDRLSNGPLTLAEIDRVFTQLADALHYAHENGVIHRDIKPSNAMLDKRGDIFLTDFGIAKLLEGSALMTATGAITGTPAYMSPEQAQGQKADQRSDVYSLGIVLYEMLVGRVPFEAETPMAVIFKQIQDPPPPLSVVRPDLPPEIEPVLLRALSKSPEYRFGSMEEFLAAWKLVFENLGKPASAPAPVLAPAPDATLRAKEPAPALAADKPVSTAPRKPFPWKLAAIGVTVALFACAALVAFLILRPRLLAARQAGARATQTAEAASTAGGAQPAATALPPISPDSASGWQSWPGGNSFYSLAVLNGQVYAAGAGGLTVWNPESGESSKISTRDGLPDSWSPVVYVDPLDQSIWVGTGNGLAHLENGQVTAVYHAENGLDSNYISAIARRGDKLVVGTTYCGGDGCGLQEFDGSGWNSIAGFPSTEFPEGEQVSYNINALLVDGEDQLWAATPNGVAMLDAEGDWNVFNPSTGLPDVRALQLALDADGVVWVGTGVGGVAKFNPDAWGFEQVLNLDERGVYDVRGLVFDSDDNLWAAGYNVARYNLQTEQLDVFSIEDGSLPVNNAVSLAIDDTGTVFIGTEGNGLMRYDGQFNQWLEPGVVSSASYRRILPGPGGVLFAVELYLNSTDVYDPTSGEWRWYGDGPEGGVPMLVDAAGNLWLGGYNGLWMVNSTDTTHFDTRLGLPVNDVYQVQVAEDGSVYALNGEGVTIIQNGKVAKVFNPGDAGFSEQPIRLIYLARNQNLYAAANDGRMVGRYDPAAQTWEWLDLPEMLGISPAPISSVAETTQGLVIGTEGNGLYRFIDGKWENVRSTDPNVKLPNDYITWIETAPDGAVWFCVSEAGVARFDGEAWSFITVEDGLADNTVNDLYFAPDGGIWFATNAGISHMLP